MDDLGCPKSAADRILLDPRSVPRVPFPLEILVAHNRHQNAISEAAQEAYERRRRHWDAQLLLRRLNSMPASNGSYGDSAVYDSDSENDTSAGQTSPCNRPRRHSIFSGAFRIQMAPNLLSRARAASVPATDHNATGSSGGRRATYRGSAVRAATPVLQAALNGVHDPIAKMRLRCSVLKSPLLSTQVLSKRALSQASVDEAHPAWHAHLRAEYRRRGADSVWRKERDQFLLGSRRRRLLAAAERRRSL